MGGRGKIFQKGKWIFRPPPTALPSRPKKETVQATPNSSDAYDEIPNLEAILGAVEKDTPQPSPPSWLTQRMSKKWDPKQKKFCGRRMAQREFSSRRDSPVMVRLLEEIVAAQNK